MVPYITVLKARLSARFHVQLELTRVPQEFQTPAAIPVEGRVLQIFRSDSSLSLGDKLIFEVHICRRGDEIPLGPSFMQYENFLSMRYMEAFLNGVPPRCNVPLDNCTMLSAPTRTPQLPASRREYLVEKLKWDLHRIR